MRCFALLILLSAWPVAVGATGVAAARPGPAAVAVDTPVWRLERVLRIGDLDREDYALAHVGPVAVGPENRLYVSQPWQQHIRVFDREGRFVRRIGREGGGPGEFRSISHMYFVGRVLRVGDPMAARVTDFDADGTVIRTHRTRAVRLDPTFSVSVPHAIAVDGTQYLLPTTREFNADTHRALLASTPDGGVHTIAAIRLGGGAVRLESPSRWNLMWQPPVHERTLFAVDVASGDVVLAERPLPSNRTTHTWELLRISKTGDTLLHGRFEYRPVAIPRDVVERERRREIEKHVAAHVGGPLPVTRQDVEYIFADGFRVPPFQAPVDELLLGQNREIWLRIGAFGEPRVRWIVLDQNGALRGSIIIPATARLVWASQSHVVLIETDELDVQYVNVYEIRR